MKYLFFILFVALFLPNLGFGTRTVNGTVQLSDYIIGPYLAVAVVISWKNRHPQLIDRILPSMLAFVAWAFIGAVLITWRFNYSDNDVTYFSLLKLAKFVLYGSAGVFTAKALRDARIWRQFDWTLLSAGCVLSAGRLMRISDPLGGPALGHALEGYQSSDAISVTLSILGCYLAARYLSLNRRSTYWRIIAPPLLLLIIIGEAAAHGRGGMLAGLVGLCFAIWRQGINSKTASVITMVMTALAASYIFLTAFHVEVNETLWPDPSHQARYHGAATIDDGSRLYTWAHEAPKLLNYPFLGTGFFHRGGQSGLWDTGAHNFFIEMFLETGLVGGLLVLAILWVMWRHASHPRVERAGCGFALKAAIIAAVVGGMGEGYFYGGVAMFSLLAVYAHSGSFPISSPFRSYRLAPERAIVTQHTDLDLGQFAQGSARTRQ